MSSLTPTTFEKWRDGYRLAAGYGILLLAATVLQSGGYNGGHVVLTFCAAVGGRTAGALVGAMAGMLWDAFAQREILYHGVLLCVTGFAAGIVYEKTYLRGWSNCLLMAVFFSVLYRLPWHELSAFTWETAIKSAVEAVGWVGVFYPTTRRIRQWAKKKT